MQLDTTRNGCDNTLRLMLLLLMLLLLLLQNSKVKEFFALATPQSVALSMNFFFFDFFLQKNVSNDLLILYDDLFDHYPVSSSNDVKTCDVIIG